MPLASSNSKIELDSMMRRTVCGTALPSLSPTNTIGATFRCVISAKTASAVHPKCLVALIGSKIYCARCVDDAAREGLVITSFSDVDIWQHTSSKTSYKFKLTTRARCPNTYELVRISMLCAGDSYNFLLMLA